MTDMPAAIIFDLDGTLVSSSLNFAQLCRETGCVPGQDILAYTRGLSGSERKRVETIISDHEMHDALSSEILPGVELALEALDQRGVKTAIVTRNSAEATHVKLVRADIKVEHVISREGAPPKPAPDALLSLAKYWQLAPADCLYVGDFRYDIEAALRANMHAALFVEDEMPEYAEQAHFTFFSYDSFIVNLTHYWQGVSEFR